MTEKGEGRHGEERREEEKERKGMTFGKRGEDDRGGKEKEAGQARRGKKRGE